MITATTATDNVAISSSARADAKAVRRVARVARRCCADTRRTASAWVSARRNAVSTGKARIISSRCADSRAVASADSATLSAVYLPIRIANNGTSGTVNAITTAAGQSMNRIAAPTDTGTTAAFTSAGKYTVKYASSASKPFVTSTVNAAGPCEEIHSGPRANDVSSTRARSSSLAPAAARAATTWVAHVNKARAMTDPTRTTSNPWPVTTEASDHAWATNARDERKARTKQRAKARRADAGSAPSGPLPSRSWAGFRRPGKLMAHAPAGCARCRCACGRPSRSSPGTPVPRARRSRRSTSSPAGCTGWTRSPRWSARTTGPLWTG
ncbi:hypothetical protein KIPE111705_35315 [Kibdelosporangium persicum]